MSSLLSEFHDCEEALSNFSFDNLYESSLELFKALMFPVTPLEDCVNQNIGEFLYHQIEKKILYHSTEWELLDKILSISTLFLINIEEENTIKKIKESRKNEIIFIAIDLNSELRDRSSDSHAITKIINKFFPQDIVILFLHQDQILFSGVVNDFEAKNLNEEVFLSDWINLKENSVLSSNKLLALAFGNHSQKNIKELYEDIIVSFSRNYYIYPESDDYIKYGIVSEKIDIEEKTLIEVSEEYQNTNFNKYRDDYVDFKEIIEVSLTDEEDLLSLSFDMEYLQLDEELVNEELETNHEFDLDYEDEDDIDETVFSDPLKLLDYLDSN